jgi:hypothetical protein
MSDAQEFLSALWGDEPGAQILIWEHPAKISYWFSDTAAAAAKAEELGRRTNVYVGCGLAPEGLGASERCSKAQVVGIPGIWADLDFAIAGHKKKNLPPDRDCLDLLLGELPLKPSVIVDTGGGYHVWWLFKEPLIFEDNDTRLTAAAVVEGWQRLIERTSRRHGWAVDQTFDLARVLRIPGTKNHKHGNQVGFKLTDGPRYEDLETFREVMPAQVGHVEIKEPKIGEFILDPSAVPPFEKWTKLCEIIPEVKAVWEHKKQMPSCSEYDMSLASFAASANWTDQEVINLLIAHRKQHGEDLKLREDYYRTTLKKVRQKYQHKAGLDALQEIGDKISHGDATPETAREQILENVSSCLGVVIDGLDRIVHHPDPNEYRLHLSGIEVNLGGIENLARFGPFRMAVFSAAKYRITHEFKSPAWGEIAQQLMNIAIDVDLGDEGSAEGNTWLLLQDWLDEWGLARDPEEGLRNGQAFEDSGFIHFQLKNFMTWLASRGFRSLGRKTVTGHLRMRGASNVTLSISKKRAKVWKISRPDVENNDHKGGDTD